MSRITWTLEECTVDDPWTQQQETHTVRTGWACECGKVPPTRLRSWTLEDHAASHLIEHGAPTMASEPCICGWVYTSIAYEDAGNILRRHQIHHHRWLVEVWDA